MTRSVSKCVVLMAVAAGVAHAAEWTVTTSPASTVVQREGITGAGQVVADAVGRLTVHYPNHPDDFGGSGGTGTSHSSDGGLTWTQGPDDWPMTKMVDLWQDRMRNGEMIAFGIRWTPDPKKRGELTASDVPSDAYSIATTRDAGKAWTPEPAVLDCPPEFGVIARPLPHIFEGERETLLMPAYAWGKNGNYALLMTSADRGRHWSVLSSITTAAAMVKTGAPVTTPWLETTVARTPNGHLLAVVRTGSSAAAALVAVRSVDQGKTWEPPEPLVAGPEKRPVAGKLPTLQVLPNGVLALLTAHSKNHCRLYLSADGTGRVWSEAFIITSQSGGNAGMTVTGPDSLVVITPANRRIDAWRVTVRRKANSLADLAAPTKIEFAKGVLSWSPSEGAIAYQVTPVLIRPSGAFTETEVYSHATIQTSDNSPRLDLSRQLLIGGTYRFEVAAVDGGGRVSSAGVSPMLTH